MTVCIPAHDEAATIGAIVERLRAEYVERRRVVDEIIVVDDHSTDATAAIASAAGARVVRPRVAPAAPGRGAGKGAAIARSLEACSTDLIGWMDGDLTEFPRRMWRTVLRPLMADRRVELVKGAFVRRGDDGVARVGGRVTALTARPLLAATFPELAFLTDPLSGVFAGRTDTLAALRIDADYGVDVGLVIDVAAAHGASSVVEVRLGELEHRRRDIDELERTAEQVVRTIITRASRSGVSSTPVALRSA